MVVVIAGATALTACGTGAEPAPQPPPPAAPVAIPPTTPTKQLFVSPSGDDGNPGTQAAPLRSIDRAAKMATPGTNVVVENGTYDGTVNTDVSGTAEARIAFTAQSRGGAKIVADGSGDAAWLNNGDYVDIVGFDITGSTTDGLVSGGSYGRIISNSVHDFREGNCIATANENYDMHDIDVIGNIAAHCGADKLDHGIYVSHPNGMVTNNIAYGNAGFGIQCWHNCNALSISNNLVFDNPEGGIVIGQGDGPNNGRVDADNFVVANNISVDNGREGIRESGATGPNNQFLNNILWDNETNRILLKTGTERGTLVTDPQFVDFKSDGSGDYHLRPGSPALGAGVELGAPATDIDGKPRPPEGGVDIGIYQQ
jgi:Right handed beta helix region